MVLLQERRRRRSAVLVCLLVGECTGRSDWWLEDTGAAPVVAVQAPTFSTASAVFEPVPGAELSFTPGSESETWLILASAQSRSTARTNLRSVEARLLVNGVEHAR